MEEKNEVRGVTRSRRFRGLAKLSPGCSPCLDGPPRWSRHTPYADCDGVAGGGSAGEAHLVREPGESLARAGALFPRSAEGECAPKIRSGAKHLGGGRGRAVACAHWLPQGGGKTSADGLQMRLRAARSPPHKSAGAARRPSRDASFSKARGADQYLHGSGKKSSSTNSPN